MQEFLSAHIRSWIEKKFDLIQSFFSIKKYDCFVFIEHSYSTRYKLYWIFFVLLFTKKIDGNIVIKYDDNDYDLNKIFVLPLLCLIKTMTRETKNKISSTCLIIHSFISLRLSSIC